MGRTSRRNRVAGPGGKAGNGRPDSPAFPFDRAGGES